MPVLAPFVQSGITVHWAESLADLPLAENGVEIPEAFQLYQNYPNPLNPPDNVVRQPKDRGIVLSNRVNPSTTIRFALPQREHLTLKVFDVLGREVALLVEGAMNAGKHAIKFNASNLPSGVYFYQLTAGQFTRLDNSDFQTKGHRKAISNGVTQTRKALLMK